MAKSVNKASAEDKKYAKEIEKLQSQFNDILSSELKSLDGETADRRDRQAALYNRFLRTVQQDTRNINREKSPNQSTYDYIASALTGSNANVDISDPKEQKRLKTQLERLFSGGDAEIATYFMNNGMDNMQIYDEIDSICAYMYQLDEAIDIIRDNVLTSEEVSEGISMDIKFQGISDDDAVEYKKAIMDMFRNEGMTTKLKSHIVKNTVKYGSEYVMIVPYTEITDKLNNLRGGFGISENVSVFESVENCSDSNYTLESAMADVASILDIDVKQHNEMAKDKNFCFTGNDYVYETICNNLKSMSICENTEAPNITGFSYDKLSKMDEHMLKSITKAMEDSHKDLNKNTKPRKGTKEYSEGLIDKDALDGIKGCYSKICDPREMRPIKIFDFTIGYYYFENYDYAYQGTSLTDMLSNTMNFDEKTQTIDRLVNSVLGKLKYGDILSGDKQFRNLILNCLMYTEQRDNPIRIKFVPKDYVVEFKTNLDKNENGQPVLLRSLFFARLYISLLLFYISAIIVKSTDSEFYYLRENALDPQYENQVTDVMDQLQQNNYDPLAIAQGQMLNTSKAINKRYFMSLGTGGDKAFDIDVMSGQNIDVKTEFLTDIKKMAIGSTGVPSVMIDLVDEVEYATQIDMSNIKNLKRSNAIQVDINPSLTKYAQIYAKFTTNLPQDVIDKMYITLRPSKTIQNNITSNQVNDVAGIADTMVKAWYRGDDSGEPSEFDKRVMEKVKKALIVALAPSAPWEMLDEAIEDAIITVRAEMEKDKVLASDNTGE